MPKTAESAENRKSFGSNQILHQVDFHLQKGQVHALLGANGAGKSTLMKIIAGEYTKDAGTIRIEGEEVHILSPGHAKRQGISVIHQELSLVPEFTVAENVYLGKEPKTRTGIISSVSERSR